MICFFISGEEKEILPGTRLWELPLSGKKSQVSRGIANGPCVKDSGITVGDYFTASGRFLSRDHFSLVKKGIEAILKRRVSKGSLKKISVFLEKHGAFYHPLKIQVTLTDNCLVPFVLNGAVSEPGLALIESEVGLISGLHARYSESYLPDIHGSGFVETDKGRIGFFLGEWFEGYKEFHVTEDRGKREVVIWESDGSCRYISESDALPIYWEVSRILTCYYDMISSNHIFPWHHSAGDFIVRLTNGKPKVRLVTVRGYSPVAGSHGEERNSIDPQNEDLPPPSQILASLLFFFLQLSVRIRLDRLNGIGTAILLEEKILGAAIEGFLNALDMKSKAYDFGDIRAAFQSFFLNFSLEQIVGIMEQILESNQVNNAEMELVEKNLESHCRFLYSFLENR